MEDGNKKRTGVTLRSETLNLKDDESTTRSSVHSVRTAIRHVTGEAEVAGSGR